MQQAPLLEAQLAGGAGSGDLEEAGLAGPREEPEHVRQRKRREVTL